MKIKESWRVFWALEGLMRVSRVEGGGLVGARRVQKGSGEFE